MRSDIRLHFAVADLPCVGLFTERNQMHYISFCIQFSSLLRLEIANSFIIYFYRAFCKHIKHDRPPYSMHKQCRCLAVFTLFNVLNYVLLQHALTFSDLIIQMLIFPCLNLLIKGRFFIFEYVYTQQT